MQNKIFDLDEIEIKIKINEKDSMLAQVSLSYDDLKLYGFRVMKSRYGDGLFIQPPSIRANNGKYLWLTKIENPEKWHELQNKIKEKYKEIKVRYDNGEFDEELINPEEIPL